MRVAISRGIEAAGRTNILGVEAERFGNPVCWNHIPAYEFCPMAWYGEYRGKLTAAMILLLEPHDNKDGMKPAYWLTILAYLFTCYNIAFLYYVCVYWMHIILAITSAL
jgi:hypothetical protein